MWSRSGIQLVSVFRARLLISSTGAEENFRRSSNLLAASWLKRCESQSHMSARLSSAASPSLPLCFAAQVSCSIKEQDLEIVVRRRQSDCGCYICSSLGYEVLSFCSPLGKRRVWDNLYFSVCHHLCSCRLRGFVLLRSVSSLLALLNSVRLLAADTNPSYSSYLHSHLAANPLQPAASYRQVEPM